MGKSKSKGKPGVEVGYTTSVDSARGFIAPGWGIMNDSLGVQSLETITPNTDVTFSIKAGLSFSFESTKNDSNEVEALAKVGLLNHDLLPRESAIIG